jgi:dihydroxy-acid dehydratase
MRRGLPGHAFDGRPHIAIANTASDLTPCNAHLNEVAESVKQGVRSDAVLAIAMCGRPSKA